MRHYYITAAIVNITIDTLLIFIFLWMNRFLDKGGVKNRIKATLTFLFVSIFTSITQLGLALAGYYKSFEYNLLRQILFRIQVMAAIFVLPAFVLFTKTLAGLKPEKYVKPVLKVSIMFALLTFLPSFIEYNNYVFYVDGFLQPKSGYLFILFLLWAGYIFLREILYILKSNIEWKYFLALTFLVAGITGFIDGFNSLQYTKIPTSFEAGLTFANLGISLVVIKFFIEIYNENKQLNIEMIKKKLLEKEISVAREIQEEILPSMDKVGRDVNIISHYQPAKQISGDFYDFFKLSANKFGIVIGDVSGKNIPAALLMAMGINIIRTIISLKDFSPEKMLYYANNLIYKESKKGMFITLFYGIIDVKNQIFTYSSAGHNEQFFYRVNSDEIIRMKTKGIPLGILENSLYEKASLKINKNDLIFLYTDGITEALNLNNEEFGEQRVINFIKNNYLLDVHKFKEKFLKELERFSQEKDISDDRTFIVLKI